MSFKKIIRSVVAMAVLMAGSQFAFAAVVDIEGETCQVTPDHEELSKLQAEFTNLDQLEDYLTQKYGCNLKMESGLIDEILDKYTKPYVQVIINTGNTGYEGLEACGYHPQREEFTCSMAIKRRFGFAGVPAIGAGSNEWVTVCVDYGGGMELVDTASVHVHDEAFGAQPNWYFSAIVQADKKLQAQIQDGKTLKARAILSWAVPASSCNYQPVWGNQADFRIRLDP